MVVTRAEELFAWNGSVAAELILTLLVFGPVTSGFAVTVKPAVPLLAIVPKEKLTTPLVCEKLPCDAVADTKAAPAGRESVRTLAWAEEGPALLTLSV